MCPIICKLQQINVIRIKLLYIHKIWTLKHKGGTHIDDKEKSACVDEDDGGGHHGHEEGGGHADLDDRDHDGHADLDVQCTQFE